MDRMKGWWVPSISLRMECYRIGGLSKISQPIMAKTREDARGILSSKLVAMARWIRSGESSVTMKDFKAIVKIARRSKDIGRNK